MQWLIDQQAFAELKTIHDAIVGGAKPEDIGAFLLLQNEDKDDDIMTIEGGVATIEINGVLRNTGNPWWGTGYPDITDAIDRAEADIDVESIDFKVNSPGGMVSGLFDLTDRMAEITKPTRSLVSNLAASAAYAIVSQTDEIVATNRVATFGSIGIVQTFYVWDDEVTITSTNAPNKAPDPKTASGKKAIQSHLDALHKLFVDAISDGRTRAGESVSVDDVNSNFGRGGVFLAEEAVKRGMADKLDDNKKIVVNNSQSATFEDKTTAIDSGSTVKEGTTMDLATLKASHPALYAQVIEQGQTAERDRVAAHLTYGESMGAMDIASKAIKEGTAITEALRAEYMTAGMNKQSIDAIVEDDDAAPAATASEDTTSAEDHTDAIFAIVDNDLGIDGDK